MRAAPGDPLPVAQRQEELEALRAAMPVPDFGGRSDTVWRYRELLPIRDDRFADTLGEGRTPLLALGPRARAAAGMEDGR